MIFQTEINDSDLELSDYTADTFQTRLNSITEEAHNQADKKRRELVIEGIDLDLPEAQVLITKVQELKAAAIAAEVVADPQVQP